MLTKLDSYDRARLTADRDRTWAEISGSPLAVAALHTAVTRTS
ncbi:hypothetical protein ACF1AO_30440 [Streptomyces longwoodensis]